MTPRVLVSAHGAVAVVTLDDPDRRNVLSAALVASLADAYDQLEADPAVRVVVLTGAGSAFCAGAELGVLADPGPGFQRVETVYSGFLRVLHSPLPTIAAINGPAVGAGFNLALAADIRLADVRARFEARFADLAVHPGGGHCWLLEQAIGRQAATMVTLLGESVDAATAARIGLVWSVHETGELLDAALALGGRLASQDRDYVISLTATLRGAASMSHAEAVEHERAAQRVSLSTPAFRERLAALSTRISARSTA